MCHRPRCCAIRLLSEPDDEPAAVGAAFLLQDVLCVLFGAREGMLDIEGVVHAGGELDPDHSSRVFSVKLVSTNDGLCALVKVCSC